MLKVMKFGGGCLKGTENFFQTRDIIKGEKAKTIIVVSAVSGVTDKLVASIDMALSSEKNVPGQILMLTELHQSLCEATIKDPFRQRALMQVINKKLKKLERLLYGIAYTEEISDYLRADIVSYGERLTAFLLAAVLEDGGIPALAIEADKAGMITDDNPNNATMIASRVKKELRESLMESLDSGKVPVLTGFLGRSKHGRVTTFGRNGTDYSAAVAAFAVDADRLEIWKEVDGFMTADPRMVKTATRIDRLSYYEAAELSYFGAKVLHPRTVEPLQARGTPIFIRNINNPKNGTTEIVQRGFETVDVIKSVTCNKKIAILKIQGAGVGYKPGIIAEIGRIISSIGVNIYSVITSQTCINLLVDRVDAQKSRDALLGLEEGAIDKVEIHDRQALVGVVGEGMLSKKGILARVMNAIAGENINVEMVSSGASDIASYLIVSEKDVDRTVNAIHNDYFPVK